MSPVVLGAGCARGSADSRNAAAPPAARSAQTNACERKILTKNDIEGILREPVTEMRTLEGDPQSCTFETAGFLSLTVSVRPGLGNVTVQTWASGKMPASATPLPGIGDRAVWQDEMHELIATKDDVLCDMAATGSALPAAALQGRLGGLCAKVFAAR